MSANQKLCYSPSEAAEILGICKNLVYRCLEDGTIRSFKVRQRRMINREALDDFRFQLERQHTSKMRGDS